MVVGSGPRSVRLRLRPGPRRARRPRAGADDLCGLGGSVTRLGVRLSGDRIGHDGLLDSASATLSATRHRPRPHLRLRRPRGPRRRSRRRPPRRRRPRPRPPLRPRGRGTPRTRLVGDLLDSSASTTASPTSSSGTRHLRGPARRPPRRPWRARRRRPRRLPSRWPPRRDVGDHVRSTAASTATSATAAQRPPRRRPPRAGLDRDRLVDRFDRGDLDSSAVSSATAASSASLTASPTASSMTASTVVMVAGSSAATAAARSSTAWAVASVASLAACSALLCSTVNVVVSFGSISCRDDEQSPSDTLGLSPSAVGRPCPGGLVRLLRSGRARASAWALPAGPAHPTTQSSSGDNEPRTTGSDARAARPRHPRPTPSRRPSPDGRSLAAECLQSLVVRGTPDELGRARRAGPRVASPARQVPRLRARRGTGSSSTRCSPVASGSAAPGASRCPQTAV